MPWILWQRIGWIPTLNLIDVRDEHALRFAERARIVRVGINDDSGICVVIIIVNTNILAQPSGISHAHPHAAHGGHAAELVIVFPLQ